MLYRKKQTGAAAATSLSITLQLQPALLGRVDQATAPPPAQKVHTELDVFGKETEAGQGGAGWGGGDTGEETYFKRINHVSAQNQQATLTLIQFCPELSLHCTMISPW